MTIWGHSPATNKGIAMNDIVLTILIAIPVSIVVSGLNCLVVYLGKLIYFNRKGTIGTKNLGEIPETQGKIDLF